MIKIRPLISMQNIFLEKVYVCTEKRLEGYTLTLTGGMSGCLN